MNLSYNYKLPDSDYKNNVKPGQNNFKKDIKKDLTPKLLKMMNHVLRIVVKLGIVFSIIAKFIVKYIFLFEFNFINSIKKLLFLHYFFTSSTIIFVLK